MGTDRETSASKQEVEALQEQREWLRVTLSSIGDAVITTDTKGCVTFLNPVAESLTGWTQDEACSVPLENVFKIVNEETRLTVENPAIRALREGVVVGLGNHTLLIAKDGTERPVDDSAAPIRNANGEVAGVVLVFRDITERRRQERLVHDALNYCECIIATLREPFIVLDSTLRIKTANRCFYETFNVLPEETENRFIFDLGNRQWDIPRLRTLLEEVLNDHHAIHDFEVEHTFPTIGRKVMLLNGRRFVSVDSQPS
jgi:PAS domain S-box-containing protein